MFPQVLSNSACQATCLRGSVLKIRRQFRDTKFRYIRILRPDPATRREASDRSQCQTEPGELWFYEIPPRLTHERYRYVLNISGPEVFPGVKTTAPPPSLSAAVSLASPSCYPPLRLAICPECLQDVISRCSVHRDIAPPPATEKHVQLEFTANRDQLFTARIAIANLADMAGTVSVSVRAESEKGFDKSKPQNGVLEPLREADLVQ